MKKIILAGILILLLLVSGFFYRQWVRSPKYSLIQASKAIKNHDLVSFEKYVDAEGLISRLIDQSYSLNEKHRKEPTNDWEQIGYNLGKMIANLVKPQVVTTMKEQLFYFVEKGDFENQHKTIENPWIPAKKIYTQTLTEKSWFRGIEYVRQEGKITIIGIKFIQEQYNKTLILDIKMRERGGYWQVAELSNFFDVIEKIRELSFIKQALNGATFQEGLTTLEIDGKWGFINELGDVVIQRQFDSAYDFHEGIARVKVGDKWGYIDKSGKTLVAPQFDEIFDFSQGLAKVMLDGRPGCIDNAGRYIINPTTDEVSSFQDGLARARISGKWGYVDESFKIVIPPQFDDASDFYDELARVKTGTKWGYVDKLGKIAINPQFDDAYDFEKKVAQVKIGSKLGYIDKSGRFMVKPQFDKILGFPSEKLPRVEIEGRWGFIDKKGNMIVPPQFDEAYEHCEGLARIRMGAKWGYIDQKGEIIVKPQFDKAWDFNGGFAKVMPVRISGVTMKYGLIDRTGKIVDARGLVDDRWVDFSEKPTR